MGLRRERWVFSGGKRGFGKVRAGKAGSIPGGCGRGDYVTEKRGKFGVTRRGFRGGGVWLAKGRVWRRLGGSGRNYLRNIGRILPSSNSSEHRICTANRGCKNH
ncbi:hypothetical protein Zmor_016088 [Zophobas morio]|uniref:Uncharacterized protein n=1 Tax=Zophobas morio TaxID=2755281 RepID=A0AA38MI88_9CUCU|nr:hypothetical protein Zmor_016088 [Zophobas morio]